MQETPHSHQSDQGRVLAMGWTPLGFKKHRGKTLPQVIFADPDWFFYMYENRRFKSGHAVEAEEIYKRATSIKIRQDGKEELVADYFRDPVTDRFYGISIGPQSSPRPECRRSFLYRTDVIDLSVPRLFADYDKSGYRDLIGTLKNHFFGSTSYKMTKKRCEAFFDDDSKFVLGQEV